jgi:hypothetical protein
VIQFNPVTASNPILPLGTVLNHTFQSAWIPLAKVLSYGIQIQFTDTCSGAWTLQVSSDPVNQALATGNLTATLNAPVMFNTLDNSSFTVSGGGTTGWNYELPPGYNWVRVSYVDSSGGSGTGTITRFQVSGKSM